MVGCSRQPPHQEAKESCTEKQVFACSNRTAADQPIELASLKPDRRTRSAKLTIAAAKKLPHHRARDNAPAHLLTKKAKPTVTASGAQLPTAGVPLPPLSLKAEREPRSSANPAADSGTTGLSVADPRPTVGLAPSSNSRTTKERVVAATAVAEQMTVATAFARRDGADPIAVVAIVIVRPEIPSLFALTAKSVAIDDRYLVSVAEIGIAMVESDGPVVQLSSGRKAAIDRLVDGEVSAAVLALVSADAAEAFPEVEGFKIFRIPLLSRYLKPRR